MEKAIAEIGLIELPEKESLGIKVDKTLIKQFARRIYGTIKEQMITDREEAEQLLNYIFGDVRDEVIKALSDKNK
jgi:hypothetical protein